MKNQISMSVVEDMDEVRQKIKRIIDESEEFICLSTYSNAEKALEELPRLSPDIVLMDINLPGMSGIECIKEVKKKCPQIQFMMFTIYENSEQVYEALAAGANGYLLKQTPPEEILRALKELYEGGAPMSTHIARKVVSFFQKENKNNPEHSADLSKREKQVLELLSKGFLYKEISDQLFISTGTVRQHIHKIYEKLHVQNRTEAINKFYGRH
ncbi:MAG: response regulator transcription factor [Ginsengibacter sp.]